MKGENGNIFHSVSSNFEEIENASMWIQVISDLICVWCEVFECIRFEYPNFLVFGMNDWSN